MPKISAVMALYNTPNSFLRITVESVLNQSLSDFEFIIIDDASTVDYKEFFDSFNDERIKYFKLEKNSGPGHARNIGIKKAVGEYIAIVDSDDVYMKSRLEIQAKFLDENKEISLIGAKFKFSNKKNASSIIKKDSEIKTFMLFNSPFANSLIMIRRNIFIEKGLSYPENKNFGEDYELWIDSMFAGLKMANLEEMLMIYTRRKNQLSKSKINEQCSILKELYRKVLQNLNIEVSETELELHYNIYAQKFGLISLDSISDWFDKIIKCNKIDNFINSQSLIDEKQKTIEKYNRFKDRLFKLKIGEFNFCLYKQFKVAIEKRD